MRASSSRSPTRRRIRCVERSADAAASWSAPWSDSTSSSRFASTLVSGVRSSCEASATNARWRSSVASVSSRAAESESSIPRSVRESSATSSSAVGSGSVRLGSRVRSISAAAAVSSAIGVIARRATSAPAAIRQDRPGEHAEREQQLEVADLALQRGDREPELDVVREGAVDAERCLEACRPCSAPLWCSPGHERPERRGARRVHDLAGEREDRAPCRRR